MGAAVLLPGPYPVCVVLQGVWASKFNERAMLSMRKVGLDFRDLRMAVVVQVSLLWSAVLQHGCISLCMSSRHFIWLKAGRYTACQHW